MSTLEVIVIVSIGVLAVINLVICAGLIKAQRFSLSKLNQLEQTLVQAIKGGRFKFTGVAVDESEEDTLQS